MEFFLPLFTVLDCRYRPVQLVSLLLAASIDFLLLLVTQFVESCFRDLEFEADGDVRAGAGRRTGGWVVLVCRHMRLLLLFPLGDHEITKTRVPRVSTVSLDWRKHPLLALIESQVWLEGGGGGRRF